MPQELDQDAVRLAKAIRQKESGGNFTAKGASGEYGAYQFTKPTWQKSAQKYLGNANSSLTPENQNKVAYSQIKEWKDSGYQPDQIASMWNSGKPDAHKTGLRGTNSMGVNYDVPAYVAGVQQEYQKIKQTEPQQQQPQVQQSSNFAPQPQQPQKSFMEKTAGVLDTVFGGGKIGGAIGTKIAEMQATPEEREAVKQFGSNTFQGPSKKEILGDVGRVALNFTPYGKATGALTSRLASEGLKRGAKPLANIAVGLGTGYGFDIAENARQNKENIYKPGPGTVVGGALPVAGPALKLLSRGVGAGTKFATAQATGLSPKTISSILENPQAFSKKAMSGVTREGVAKDVFSTIQKGKKELSETGKLYEPLRNAQGSVRVDKNAVTDVLNKYGLSLKNGKILTSAESRPMAKTDLKAIEDFVGQYGKSIRLSNNAYFNAKERLSQLSKYEMGRADTARNLARDLRGAYEKVGDEQITGLQKLDELYGPQKRQLKQLEKDYFNRDGSFKDGAVTKIANLSNKGREQILQRLEEVKPGVGKQIEVLKAIEDIENAFGQKVGTYTRAAVTGGALMTGNVPIAVISAILSHPGSAVPILRAAGIARNQIGKVIQSLKGFLQQQTAQGLTPGDRILNTKVGQNASKSLMESAKNPSMGLSTRDVTKRKLSMQEAERITDDLINYDAAPVTMSSRSNAISDYSGGMNQTLDFGGEANTRLDLLKNKNMQKPLTNAELHEVDALLKKVGGSSVEPVSNTGLRTKGNLNKPTPIRTPDNKRLAGSKSTKNSLEQEAKKYKSAEEFVKAKYGEPMYHATRDTKMKSFDTEYDYEAHTARTDVGQIRDYETPYGKVFMTNDLKEAKAYGENVLEVFYDGKPKIKTIKTGDVPPSRYFDNEYNWGKLADTVENGDYDILKFVDNKGKTTYLSYPEKLKTKSQLIDIWNKANQTLD